MVTIVETIMIHIIKRKQLLHLHTTEDQKGIASDIDKSIHSFESTELGNHTMGMSACIMYENIATALYANKRRKVILL